MVRVRFNFHAGPLDIALQYVHGLHIGSEITERVQPYHRDDQHQHPRDGPDEHPRRPQMEGGG